MTHGATAPTVALPTPPAAVKALPKPKLPETQGWNTKNLGWRLGSDVASAASAGALVAPVISIIDRSIMENASGRNTLAASLRQSFTNLLLRPHTIIASKPFLLIFMLYGGTYLTANTVDTVTSTITNRKASTITCGTNKFVASSAANVGLCIYKDQHFVRMFGPLNAVARPVPGPSYVLFALRDSLTIFASFNVPPLLAPHITEKLSQETQRHVSGATIAQFAAPAAVQLISTPLHLLGLDLYNRPGGSPTVPWRDRWNIISKNWLISAVARIGRIVPAFGIGGVVNMKMRNNFMEKFE